MDDVLGVAGVWVEGALDDLHPVEIAALRILEGPDRGRVGVEDRESILCRRVGAQEGGSAISLRSGFEDVQAGREKKCQNRAGGGRHSGQVDDS
jgi:hypothetical protein